MRRPSDNDQSRSARCRCASSEAPAWPASRPFAATGGSGATLRRSTCRRGSTVRRRQPASIGSMPSVASHGESSGLPRTTAMPAGGDRGGRTAGVVPSGQLTANLRPEPSSLFEWRAQRKSASLTLPSSTSLHLSVQKNLRRSASESVSPPVSVASSGGSRADRATGSLNQPRSGSPLKAGGRP